MHSEDTSDGTQGLPAGPGARIKYVRRHLGLSQTEFAARLGLSQSTLSQIENDRYYPSYDTLLYLVGDLGIDSNWLLLGRGAPYGDDREPPPAPPDGYPAVTEKARAGYAATDRDEHWLSRLTHYEVPGFPPDADIVVFQVIGDSMRPTLEDQDFVLAERTDGGLASCVGQPVVIVVPDEIYVKRLTNVDLVTRRLTLASDNPEYPTIEIAEGEALESWRVVGRITRRLAAASLDQDLRLHRLEVSVRDLRQELAELSVRVARRAP